MSAPRPAVVVVLAAGEGTRMKSATPKVLHRLCGRTMLGHVVTAARDLEPKQLLVVVGHGRDLVAEHLAAVEPTARPVVQEPQHGTGHAVRIALDAVGPVNGTVVVVNGDLPLLTTQTLRRLVEGHVDRAASVLSAVLPNPTGYGRVVRDAGGTLAAIVEEKDATPEQRALTEANMGVYAFDGALLRAALDRLTTANAQREEYLTDVLRILAKDGHPVDALPVEDYRELLGVNDRVELAQARRLFRDRLVTRWMREGVTVVDPQTTWMGVGVTLEPDVVIHQNTQLHGRTHIAGGAEVGPNSTLRDTLVGERATVVNATCEGAEIGPDATVGPYTYLRPGTRLGRGAKAGGFVEMKAAVVGEGSKVPHLSYVGDADIGDHSNIGAATVFVNYDGQAKHRTTVGEHVRIGGDTMLVAPVSVGDGAYTAAGSVITDDVPPGALGVSRGRQRNVEGWVERRRAGTPAAQAAARARAGGEPAAGAAGSGAEAAAGAGGPPEAAAGEPTGKTATGQTGTDAHPSEGTAG